MKVRKFADKESFDELLASDSALDNIEVQGRDEVWAKVQDGIKKEARRKLIWSNVKRASAVAAVVILFFAVKTFVGLNDYVIIETAFLDTPQEVILPDGSMIWLNSNSKLKYPKQFSEDIREVSFEGLGYFSVEKDTTRPFVIESPRSQVRVLGTSFSIEAYKDTPVEEVYLKEGSVVFTSAKEEVLMKPGEIAQLNTSNAVIGKSTNLNRNIDAWKTRELYFDNDPLNYVFEELEKYTSKHFIVENQEIMNLRFNGHFIAPETSDLLDVLSYTFNLDYIINGDNVVFTNKNQ